MFPSAAETAAKQFSTFFLLATLRNIFRFMDSYLLNRLQGSIPPSLFHHALTVRLTQCLELAPTIHFNNNRSRNRTSQADAFADNDEHIWAHRSGAVVLTMDQYEKRFLISGGADSSVAVWDLETRSAELEHTHEPVATAGKGKKPGGHTRALTSLSLYPFDPTPTTLLTTAHDDTLKLSVITGSEIVPAHTFSLYATPYSHALSTHQASLLLVAVGSSDKAVRLLDLRSGLATHALPGHSAPVLSVAWAPHRPHLLASASVDGSALLFDVRRGGKQPAIASLDMDDAIGHPLDRVPADFAPRRAYTQGARAHNGVVTGIRWSDNGSRLYTAGQDARVRIFDAVTGANGLVNFGPRIRNSSSLHLAERAPLVVPTPSVPHDEMLIWPNAADSSRPELVLLDPARGQLRKILTAPVARRVGVPPALSAGRVNALAWRGNGAGGQGVELFSAHGDGKVRAWVSRMEGVEGVEGDDVGEDENEQRMRERKRKRDVLDELYRGFVGRNVRFT